MAANGGATTNPRGSGNPRSGRSGGSLERVTVNLTARSSQALDEAVHLSGDTKTDAINRAVQLYAFVEKIINEGGAVYLRHSQDGELERLRFL
jgi:hypothetical protein